MWRYASIYDDIEITYGHCFHCVFCKSNMVIESIENRWPLDEEKLNMEHESAIQEYVRYVDDAFASHRPVISGFDLEDVTGIFTSFSANVCMRSLKLERPNLKKSLSTWPVTRIATYANMVRKDSVTGHFLLSNAERPALVRFKDSFGSGCDLYATASIELASSIGVPLFFSPDLHGLFSRVSLEGRWASQDAMTRPLMRIADAITSLIAFFTISNPSFPLKVDSQAMNSEVTNPTIKLVGSKQR
ncbi:hypothetical protein CDEF62S_05013 [Castellaniella defragrans]